MRRGWRPQVEAMDGDPMPYDKREPLKKLIRKVALKKLKEMEASAMKKAA